MRLEGAYTALVTPFKDGQVDEEAFRSLVEFQIEEGISGLVPCGTTGESATMTHAEHMRVVEITIDQVKGRVPVIAGTGSNNTQEAIELTKHAKQAGADACLQVAPYYNKPTQEGMYQHFAAIAKEAPLPQVIYNIQGRTGVNIETATMVRLAEMPEVIAVKEASGSLGQMIDVQDACGDKMDLLVGDDALLLPVLGIGGKGVISVICNIVPAKMMEVINLWKEGKVAECQEKFFALLPLCKASFFETNPIPIKTATAMMGLIPNADMRLPMTPIAQGNYARLEEALKNFGLLG